MAGLLTEMQPVSRRAFLKLCGVVGAVGIGSWLFGEAVAEAAPSGYFVDDGTYQLPDGRVNVLNLRVSSGDSMQRMADRFFTYIELIYEANRLSARDTIHPGEILRVPACAKLPMSYRPELGKIRHQLGSSDNISSVSERYGIPSRVVNRAFDRGLRKTLEQGDILIIDGADSRRVLDIKMLYDETDSVPHTVMGAAVNRVFRSFLYFAGGDMSIFKLLQETDGVEVVSGAPGFAPPNNVAVFTGIWIGEGELRRELGHEFWHALPFPCWSAGSDEGTAGYAAVEIATRNKREYVGFEADQFYSPYYYDRVNSPDLRKRVFGLAPVENRILATIAWQRIEQKYPGVISYLLVSAANSKDAKSYDGAAMWPLDQVKAWVVGRFGEEAWDYIDGQHILFTS